MDKASLLAKVKSLPQKPGVYLMKNNRGRVLYVGKANALRSRLLQYFAGKDSRVKVKFLLSKLSDLEIVLTATGKEALLLENSLIKVHRPRYNVDLRDDKNFLSLKLTVKDRFPRLQFVRQIKDDGNHYFGPYTSGYGAREMVKYLYRIFPLRNCSNAFFKSRQRPCLRHQIKLCLAPCVGLIEEKSYQALILGLNSFLSGKSLEVQKKLEQEMWRLSKQEKYEAAANLRNRLAAIKTALEKQQIVNHLRSDRDILGFARLARRVCLFFLYFREGKVVGQEKFIFLDKLGSDQEIIYSFLNQYYFDKNKIPKTVVLPLFCSEKEHLQQLLSEGKGQKVSLFNAQRGENKKLQVLAATNAQESLLQLLEKDRQDWERLERIRKKLKLSKFPKQIECYDISNLGGEAIVASRVVFVNGLADKSLYRRYNFAAASSGDDFYYIGKVLQRRFLKKEKEKFPQLVVVDGGKGQLAVAAKVLAKLKEEAPQLVAIAKADKKRKLSDRLFLPGRKNPLLINSKDSDLRLFAAIRDEAHRFAIKQQRKVLRRKKIKRKKR